jgi:hypothetical protein
MKKIVLYSIITLSLLVTACDKNDDTPAPAGNEPKANSQWVFKFTSYNEAGAETGTSNLTVKAVEVTVAGSTWLNLVNQANSQPVIAIQKRTEGWWYISYPTTTPSLWFKHPATVNETYAYVFGTCTVKDVNASVTVPAGTFNGCYKVDGNDANSLEDEFWFSNTGAILIKFNTYDQKAAGPASNVYKKESLELVSFTR